MSHSVALPNPVLNLLIEQPKQIFALKSVQVSQDNYFSFKTFLTSPSTRQIMRPKDICSLQMFSDFGPEIMSGMWKVLNRGFHPTGIQLKALFAFLWSLKLCYFSNISYTAFEKLSLSLPAFVFISICLCCSLSANTSRKFQHPNVK